MRRSRVAPILWEMTLPILILVLWWVGAQRADSVFVPPLQKVVVSFVQTWFGPGFVEHLIPSILNLALGYGIGIPIGIVLGACLGLIPVLDKMFTPVVHFFRALPPPALLPFFILLLGIGFEMKIGVIAFSVASTVLLSAMGGVRSVDPTLSELCSVYRISRWKRLWHVVLPSAGPQIVAGMRTALSVALLMMVVSEMVAATRGIGFFTLQAQRTFDFPKMWAGMLLLAVLGYLLNYGFRQFEHRVLFWQMQILSASKR